MFKGLDRVDVKIYLKPNGHSLKMRVELFSTKQRINVFTQVVINCLTLQLNRGGRLSCSV